MVVWISTEQVKTQQPPISSSVLLKLDVVLRQVLVEYSYSPLLVRTSSRDPGQGRRRRRRRRRGGAAVRGDISHTLLLCLHVRQTGITNQVLQMLHVASSSCQSHDNERQSFSYDIFTLYKFPRLQFSTRQVCPLTQLPHWRLGQGNWTSETC